MRKKVVNYFEEIAYMSLSSTSRRLIHELKKNQILQQDIEHLKSACRLFSPDPMVPGPGPVAGANPAPTQQTFTPAQALHNAVKVNDHQHKEACDKVTKMMGEVFFSEFGNKLKFNFDAENPTATLTVKLSSKPSKAWYDWYTGKNSGCTFETTNLEGTKVSIKITIPLNARKTFTHDA